MARRIDLQTALLDGGVEHVSFFNGRILTADDLQDQQAAASQVHRALGRAVGWGVSAGLTVARGGDRVSVDVAPGTALAPSGEVLTVTDDITVALVPTPPATELGDATFVACTDEPTSLTSTGTGIYLLTIGSAGGTKDSAPRTDFVSGGVVQSCGPRYNVDGIQFRLIELDVVGLAVAGGHDGFDLVRLNTLGSANVSQWARNILAAVLGDVALREDVAVDPFGHGTDAVPAIDRLYDEGRLSQCEVPMCLVSWRVGAVEYIDMWPARRDAAPPTMAGHQPFLAGPGRRAAGLAAYRQFTDHLGSLVGPGVSEVDMLALQARRHFRYLPAAGLVPLITGGRGGVDPAAFFDNLEVRAGEAIPSARVGPLLDASLSSPPIDILSRERIWTFVVEDAVDPSSGQPYLAFASDLLRHMTVVHQQDTTQVVITGVSPAGDHPVGSEITVEGRNFVLPGRENDVTVGGVAVTGFNRGTDTDHLVFNVPDVPGLPRVAAIVVSNANGTAEWLTSVVDNIVIPTGEIRFTEQLEHLEGVPIVEGETFDYIWDVEAATDGPGHYTLSPVFTNAQGSTAANWLDATALLDRSGAEVGTVELRPADPDDPTSGPFRVTARVTVPAGATAVRLALDVRSVEAPTDPGLNGPSSPIDIVVGVEPEVSDRRITFESPTVTSGGSIDPNDGAVVIPVGTPVRVRVDATLHEGGTFSYAVAVEPDERGTVWGLSNVRPRPGEVVPDGAGSQEEVGVTLLASAAETEPTRTLRIDATAVDATGGTVRYRSFTRIRLRTA